MRMHSCLHMLCATIPAPVTGGSIQDGRGRLDFDLPDNIDKEATTAKLNELISGDHPMSTRWITDEELDANPELVRTLSAPPPQRRGQSQAGRVQRRRSATVRWHSCRLHWRDWSGTDTKGGKEG